MELLRWGEAILVLMFNLFSAQPLVFAVELSKRFDAILSFPLCRIVYHCISSLGSNQMRRYNDREGGVYFDVICPAALGTLKEVRLW